MIHINGVTKSFDHKKVLKGISLDITEGERVYITGKNGSGKTTLLNILLGFENSDKGNVSMEASPSDVQVIYQNQERDQYLTVADEIELASILHGGTLNSQYEKFLNIPNKKKRLTKLSGGEWQKLQVIKSIASTPKIMITDEITTGLDFESRRSLYDILETFLSKNKATYLSVSHYEEEINLFADKVVTLKDGFLYMYDNRNKDFKFEGGISYE